MINGYVTERPDEDFTKVGCGLKLGHHCHFVDVRLSHDGLISTMEFLLLARWHLDLNRGLAYMPKWDHNITGIWIGSQHFLTFRIFWNFKHPIITSIWRKSLYSGNYARMDLSNVWINPHMTYFMLDLELLKYALSLWGTAVKRPSLQEPPKPTSTEVRIYLSAIRSDNTWRLPVNPGTLQRWQG